jgi:hypothetical protein
MAIDLRKGKPGRPKGSKTKTKKSLVQPVEETTLTKEDFDVAVETIRNLQEHVEYWKRMAHVAGEDADKWVARFDILARDQEELQQFIKSNVTQLKRAFKMGMELTGQITVEDINYNLDFLPRMMDYRFFKKEDKED